MLERVCGGKLIRKYVCRNCGRKWATVNILKKSKQCPSCGSFNIQPGISSELLERHID